MNLWPFFVNMHSDSSCELNAILTINTKIVKKIRKCVVFLFIFFLGYVHFNSPLIFFVLLLFCMCYYYEIHNNLISSSLLFECVALRFTC